MVITPTAGRMVWFWPGRAETDEPVSGRPFAAIVAFVHSDRMVNLAVFNHNGQPEWHTSVPLIQEDDKKPELGRYAEWMPYQIGQARKYAADDGDGAQKSSA